MRLCAGLSTCQRAPGPLPATLDGTISDPLPPLLAILPDLLVELGEVPALLGREHLRDFDPKTEILAVEAALIV